MAAHDDRVDMPKRCTCGHALARHQLAGFDGECVSEGCRCATFILREAPVPATPPTQVRTVPPVAGTELARMIAAGKRSSIPRTVVLALRLEADARDLVERLRAEAASNAAKVRLAHPIPQLEPLPPDGPPTRRTLPKVETACEDCGETFKSAHAKGNHRRHRHPKQADMIGASA